jgi:hypothetical protein
MTSFVAHVACVCAALERPAMRTVLHFAVANLQPAGPGTRLPQSGRGAINHRTGIAGEDD